MNDFKSFFNGKRVLVTGHTGFKAAWLAYLLRHWGADVAGIALPPHTDPNLFSILELAHKIRHYEADIRDFEAVKGIFEKEKPEIVFHLAAQAIVLTGYEEPLRTHATNALGTANMMEAMRLAPSVKSAVIITSDKAYANDEREEPYNEADRLGGTDPYSASKGAADIIAQSYQNCFFGSPEQGKHPALVAIARAGNVIGGGDWSKYRLVPDLMRAVYEKHEPLALRNPESIRPWEHVLEPLSGYMLLAKKLYEGERGAIGAWNFGPDAASFVPTKDVLERSIKILGAGSFEVKPDPTKHESTLLKLDITKARTELGWEPKLTLDECLAWTLEWYKTYYTNPSELVKVTDAQIETFFTR